MQWMKRSACSRKSANARNRGAMYDLAADIRFAIGDEERFGYGALQMALTNLQPFPELRAPAQCALRRLTRGLGTRPA